MSCRAFCRHASIACMFKRKDCCAKEVKTSAFTIASHASTSAVVLRKSILTASVLVTATPCMFASMQARSCKVQTTRNTSCTMTRHSLSRKMSCHDTVHVTSEDACCLRSTRVAEDMVACVFQRSSSRVAKACWMANTPPRSARRRSPAPPQHPPSAWLAAAAQRHEQARQHPAPTAPAAQRWTAAAEAYTRGAREAAEPIAGTESMSPLARAAARELATIRANLGVTPAVFKPSRHAMVIEGRPVQVLGLVVFTEHLHCEQYAQHKHGVTSHSCTCMRTITRSTCITAQSLKWHDACHGKCVRPHVAHSNVMNHSESMSPRAKYALVLVVRV